MVLSGTASASPDSGIGSDDSQLSRQLSSSEEENESATLASNLPDIIALTISRKVSPRPLQSCSTADELFAAKNPKLSNRKARNLSAKKRRQLSPPLMVEISPDNVIYRAEGNASLVVALIREEKVLKLIKGNAKDVDRTSFDIENEDEVASSGSETVLSKSFEILTNRLELIRKIFCCIFTPRLIDVPETVYLTREQIVRLMFIIKDYRPADRLHRGVPMRDIYGLIQPDHCALHTRVPSDDRVGPVIAIEIKPKQGFLPDVDILPQELSLLSRVSRFCLAQFKHSARGHRSERSAYCPMDLFSGCPGRMRLAVMNLLETPRNNCRIFADKQFVFGEASDKKLLIRSLQEYASATTSRKPMDILVDHVVKMLMSGTGTSSGTPQQYCAVHEKRSKAHCFCEDTHHMLFDDCVMSQIVRVQRLDRLGSREAKRIFESLLEENDETHWHQVERNIIHKGLDSFEALSVDETDDFDKDAIRAFKYLLAMTAKDCSIIMAIQRLADSNKKNVSLSNAADLTVENVIRDEDTGANYLFSLKLVDLDRKCANKAMRVYSSDKEMISAYDQLANK